MKNKTFGFAVIVAGLMAMTTAVATDWSTQDYDLYPGDFDGDGKTDLLYVAKDVAKASGIARSDGSGPNIPFQSWPSNHLGIPWHDNLYSVLVADFSGDGKADVFLQRKAPGDSYLLFADANGKITGINQTVGQSALGLSWSADQHRIVAGKFNGDTKADVFLQATSPAGTNAVVLADGNGQLTILSLPTWTDASWTAFKWSTQNSNVFVGDFNGDGLDDLLLQAKPKIVLIDYDVPIPVPTYPPNMNGVVLSDGDSSPFAQAGVRQWSRNANGVDWSPNAANIIVGDFDGNGTSDVILQARNASGASYLVGGNTSGAVFQSATALATNVTWAADSFRLVAGNFDGTGGTGVYYQAVSSSGTNYYTNVVTGASVTITTHNPGAATGVLPTTAVGHTVGSFAVSPGGAATYSIPIMVPPGVAGLQPALSINYASASGNGLLGVGWDLGGFSEISRCNKSLVQDNSTDSVQLSLNDRFCLDGNKLRLITGTYGVATSTYQTELETFGKVTAVGSAGNGPASFTVETKDGLIYEYGNTADSRIEAVNAAASTTARVWAVNKVTDRHGNSMTITYQEDGAPNGSYRPAEISYTANSNVPLTAVYKVVFAWETRPAADVLIGYEAGGLVKETFRLNRVETQYNEPGVGWRLVRKYQLSYNTSGSTPRSRLGAIQECDRNGYCLAPTTISWQDGTPGWHSTDVPSSTNSAAMMQYSYVLDLNGDGRDDVVYPETVSGTTRWHFMLANTSGGFQSPLNTGINAGDGTNLQYAKAEVIDYFAEGRGGVLTKLPDYTRPQILRFNGSTLVPTDTNLTITLDGKEWVADFDGDSRLDLLYTTGAGNFYVQKNAGSTSGQAQFLAAQLFYSDTSGGDISPFTGHYADESSRLVDFNGDGRADFIYSTTTASCGGNPPSLCPFTTTWKVLTSTGTSFTQILTWFCIRIGQICGLTPVVGDFNGDGHTDALTRSGMSGSDPWRISYGTGAGLTAPANITLPTDFDWRGFTADHNVDGRADLIYAPSPTSGNWVALLSNGTAFDAPVTIALPSSSTINETVRALDLDGDGLQDLGFKNGSFVARNHKGSVPDLVRSITDGFGNNVTVQYAPLTDPAVYTKCPSSPLCAAAVFPEIDVQPSMYVVKQHNATDGLGGSYSITEAYAGLRVHVQGRGLLGFMRRTTTDGRTGISSVASFRQDFPYVGFAHTVSTYQPNGTTLISQTSSTPGTLVTSSTSFNERQFPYPSQTIERTYEVSGPSNGLQITEVTTNNTLDAYGNPTVVATITADMTGSGLSYSTSTTNTYDTGDANCWWRGFVTNRQTMKTIPGLAAQARTAQYVKDTANLPACRVYQEIIEPSDTTGTLKLTTTISYDAYGHPVSQVVSGANIEARTMSTSFGTQGVLPMSVTQSVSTSFNHTASKTYDFALGVQKSVTDPNNLTTYFDYDGFGRMTQETRPDGTKTTFSYSPCTVGNGYCGDSRLRYQVEKRELDSNNAVIRTSRQLLDGLGRDLYTQAQSLSGAFANLATNYDNLGRPHQQSQPYFSGLPAFFTTVTYDLLGRPTQEQRRVSDADSGTQTTLYSYNRLSSSITDPTGKVTTKQVNGIGQVVKMTDAASGITEYEYDPFGNLTKTKDLANNQIVNTYNIRGFKLTTSDRDMGAWLYTYYPTGELWTQRDAKNQTVTFTYDHTARPKTRIENEGTTTFTYGTSSTLKNIGKLESVSSPGAYSESFTFDSLGRLQDATTNADATSFVVSNTYDSTTGLLETVTYPTSTSAVSGSRFKVKYEYEYGMAKRARDFHSPSTIYWEQIATNAAGQAIDEQYGNGVHTYSTFDSLTGVLSARTTGATSQVQNLTYQWDKVGNLTQRRDQNLNLTEDFYYDDLYRLDYSKLNGVTNLDIGYDSLGNITSKTGVGTYTYPASGASSVRPHAVTAAGANSYGYDNNGNMTSRNGSTITWYSYNLPNRLDRGSNYSQFFYGADRGRYKQVAVTAAGGSLPAGTETTIYVGGLYERVTKPSGVVEHKHYIVAGKEAVAIRTLRSNSANDTRYLHKDHLGSLDAITNESGSVVLRLAYDAFGKRRNATSWSGATAAGDWTSIAAITHRGFTFHEELDNVDLVHMNGRVYDADIGRFISADPFVQAPLMSQSLNRYSYVMNNPLSLIDPSGYSWLSKFHRKLRRHIHAHLRFLVNPTPKNFFEAIKSTPGQDKIDRFIMTHEWAYKAGYAIAVVSSFWIGGYGGAVYQAYYTYIATGSATQAVTAGILAAGQQYIGNYMSTGSGFSMATRGRGAVVLSWDGGGTAVRGGPSLLGLFLNSLASAPATPTSRTERGADNERKSDKILSTQELLYFRGLVHDLQDRLGSIRTEEQWRTFNPGFYGSSDSEYLAWHDAVIAMQVDLNLTAIRIEGTLGGSAPASSALSALGGLAASKATGLKGVSMLWHTDRGIRYDFYYEIYPQRVDFWFVDRHSNIRYELMRRHQ